MPPKMSWPLIFSRLNKTLNFCNQVIPLYMKAKPMIKNAKDAFKVAKVFMEKTNEPKITPKPIPIKKEPQNINNPVFFL